MNVLSAHTCFCHPAIWSFQRLLFPLLLLEKSCKITQIAQINQLFNFWILFGHDYGDTYGNVTMMSVKNPLYTCIMFSWNQWEQSFTVKPVVRLRATWQYCHAMLVFWLAVCSEQVAIQISICCLSKRLFISEYCELTAMTSNNSDLVLFSRPRFRQKNEL